MYIALSFFHLVVALGLILIVLLQSGKGADIGAAFGGGSSQTVFGGRGAATFLSKMTTAFAILFMVTSILLTILSAQRGTSTLVREDKPAPATQSAPAAPAAPTPPAPAAQSAPAAPTPPAPAKAQ
jgi:preprotein translocase subunit SecG